jgi:hypothetical protein
MMIASKGRLARFGCRWLLVLAAAVVICPIPGIAQAQDAKVQDAKVQDAKIQDAKAQDVAVNSASKPAEKAGAQPGSQTPLPTDVNLQRQKQLEDDTAKLLVLANELKVEMDKSTKDTLSLTVVKKAEEIEKLARKVRGEMKTSIGN